MTDIEKRGSKAETAAVKEKQNSTSYGEQPAKNRRRMRKRFIKTSLLISITLSLLVITASFLYYNNSLHNAIRKGLEAKAKSASSFFIGYSYGADFIDGEFERAAVSFTQSFADRDRLALHFSKTDGTIIASSEGVYSGVKAPTSDVINAVETGEVSWWSGEIVDTGEEILSVSIPIVLPSGNTIGVMSYLSSLAEVSKQTANLIILVSMICAVVNIIIILINIFLGRIIFTPIENITEVAGQIAEGGYGATINKSNYRDEIDDIVISINTMSTRIAKAEKTKREFLSSISHELRTPLTAISGWSETLLFGDVTSDTKIGLEIIKRESKRLTQMVEELLEYTRMEEGRFTLNIERIDIAAEVEEAMMIYKELLPEADIQIRYLASEETIPIINGDPNRLKQVFMNLFDNAVKYAKEGKRLDVKIQLQKGSVAVIIRDYGKGVPETEIDQLKTKFYKASNSSGRGSGIGLAVCDEIIRYHGGELILENVYEQGMGEPLGFRCTVKLPLRQAG